MQQSPSIALCWMMTICVKPLQSTRNDDEALATTRRISLLLQGVMFFVFDAIV